MKKKMIVVLGTLLVANLFGAPSDAAGNAENWTPMCSQGNTMQIVQDPSEKGTLLFSVTEGAEKGYNLFPMWKNRGLKLAALRGISFSIKVTVPENGVVGEKASLIFPGSQQTFELKRDGQWQAVTLMLKEPDKGWPANWGFFQILISVPKGDKAGFSIKDIRFLDADGKELQ